MTEGQNIAYHNTMVKDCVVDKKLEKNGEKV